MQYSLLSFCIFVSFLKALAMRLLFLIPFFLFSINSSAQIDSIRVKFLITA